MIVSLTVESVARMLRQTRWWAGQEALQLLMASDTSPEIGRLLDTLRRVPGVKVDGVVPCGAWASCSPILCKASGKFWRWHIHGPLTVVEVWDPAPSADKEWRVFDQCTNREALLTLWILGG